MEDKPVKITSYFEGCSVSQYYKKASMTELVKTASNQMHGKKLMNATIEVRPY